MGKSKLTAFSLTKLAKYVYLIFAFCLLLITTCVIIILYRSAITYTNRHIYSNSSTFSAVNSFSQLHTVIIFKTNEVNETDTDIDNISDNTDITARPDIQEELKVLLQCHDKDLILDIHQTQSFWVLENYVIADRRFKCHESVTLTTQGDFTFLDNLVVLVEKWQGPVSVALYAPGADFQLTLDSIAYLRNCYVDSLVKKLVTFHLAYDYKHLPNVKNTTIKNAYVDYWKNCSHVPYEINHDQIYKQKHSLTYPINIVRNLARKTAMTHFVFPSDIELYPSTNFIEMFLSMIVNNPTLINDRLKVFVLPIFEIETGQIIPETKSELQKMVNEKKAFSFHAKICQRCHLIPNFKDWLGKPENDTLDIFESTKRLGSQRDWEPFFVGTNAEPWFDERLTWEGHQNKMVQGLIMCLMDYDYMILDNAFLVHKPGIKKSKVQNKKYKKIIDATLRLLKKNIKPELVKIYGRREGCQWIR